MPAKWLESTIRTCIYFSGDDFFTGISPTNLPSLFCLGDLAGVTKAVTIVIGNITRSLFIEWCRSEMATLTDPLNFNTN